MYSVDQVAEKLSLHPRTVRQFIRTGKLKARKVGKQWRILGSDLDYFLGKEQAALAPGLPSATENTAAADSHTEQQKIQVTAIVDVLVKDQEEASRISNSILAVMSSKGSAYGKARCDHIFYENENKVRFVLWGGAEFTGNLLVLLSRISG